MVLIACEKMALEHDACNRLVSPFDLSEEILEYRSLASIVFCAIAMRAIDNQPGLKTASLQIQGCSRERVFIEVRAGLGSSKHEMGPGISFRSKRGDGACFIDAEIDMRGSRVLDAVKGGSDLAINAVFKTDRKGER